MRERRSTAIVPHTRRCAVVHARRCAEKCAPTLLSILVIADALRSVPRPTFRPPLSPNYRCNPQCNMQRTRAHAHPDRCGWAVSVRKPQGYHGTHGHAHARADVCWVDVVLGGCGTTAVPCADIAAMGAAMAWPRHGRVPCADIAAMGALDDLAVRGGSAVQQI